VHAGDCKEAEARGELIVQYFLRGGSLPWYGLKGADKEEKFDRMKFKSELRLRHQ
jgi:hypothetical protein